MGINSDLGLPFGGGMNKNAICFDVDGTLVDNDTPHEQTQALVNAFMAQTWKNVDIIVWSGGGAQYAETIFRRWFPDAKGVQFRSKMEHQAIREKYDFIVAIDDVQDTRIGDVNLIVRNK